MIKYYSKSLVMFVVSTIILITSLVTLKMHSNIIAVVAILLALMSFLVAGLYTRNLKRSRKIARFLVESYITLSNMINLELQNGYEDKAHYSEAVEVINVANEWLDSVLHDLNLLKHNSPYYALGLENVPRIETNPDQDLKYIFGIGIGNEENTNIE